MRYSLAGGYQSNGENGHGRRLLHRGGGRKRCVIGDKNRDQGCYVGLDEQSRVTVATYWKGTTRRVNIGLAWDRYNFVAVQHFEGDYVEFESLPHFDGGKLRFEGKVKSGARVWSGRNNPGSDIL